MRKQLRTHVVIALAICLIGSLIPSAAFATETAIEEKSIDRIDIRADTRIMAQQETVVDPAVHAAAKAGVGQVSLVLRPGVSSGANAAVAGDSESPSTPSLSGLTPGDAGDGEAGEPEPEATATPDEAAVEPTPEPAVEPTAEPEEDEEPTLVPTPTPAQATGFADGGQESHTAEGVTVQVPADWEVFPGSFGTLFEMGIPDSEFVGILQSSGGDEFPGIFAVVMFRTAAEMLIQEIDPSAELVSIETLSTSQQLPVTKISYTANLAGDESAGAFYVVSPGADAYMLIAFAPPAEWGQLEDTVDLIAESTFFEPSLITLTTAEDGPFTYVDELGLIEVAVPEDWQVAETNDIDFPVIVVDPSFEFVGGVAMQPVGEAELDIDTAAILAGVDGVELSEEDAAALLATILEQLEFSADEFFINEELSEAVVIDNAILVRLAGDLALTETALMSVVIYIRLTETEVAVLLMFGEPDTILAEEGTLLEILDSMQIP